MAKESRKNNPNTSEQESEGKKKEKDRNEKSQSTNQESVKQKQSADKTKLESKTPKEEKSQNTDSMGIFEKIKSNLELFHKERTEIMGKRSDGRYKVSKQLREKWTKMHRRAKMYAAGGDFISDLGKAIAGGYSKGQSLR